MAHGYKTGGRQKGSLNKDNRDIREMIIGALSDVGGRKYLRDCAISHPVAFLGLVGKVLPMQVANANGDAIGFDFQWASAAGDENRTALAHIPNRTVDADAVTLEPAPITEEPLQFVRRKAGKQG